MACNELDSDVVLTGECNLCGLCCVGGPLTRCENLIVIGILGRPRATACSAYDVRYDGMPIAMRDAAGTTIARAACHKGCGDEAEAIVAKGLGRGCSLRLEDAR